jgi:tetratricopeptide (TPR) repeat protein
MISLPTSIPELEARLEAVGKEATKERLSVLLELAYALRVSEQWDRMITLSLEAAEIARAFEDSLSEGRALAVLAFVQYIRSDLKSALANCTKALQLTMGDEHSQANIGVIVAMVQWTLGNFDEALRHIDRSLPALREVQDQTTEAFAVVAKGGIFHSLGQYDLSVACFRDALELCRDTGFDIGVARALAGLGSAYQALGLLSAALECHKDSYAIGPSSQHIARAD